MLARLRDLDFACLMQYQLVHTGWNPSQTLRMVGGDIPCHSRHADELEGPEGAVPADTLQATEGDKVAGVT